MKIKIIIKRMQKKIRLTLKNREMKTMKIEKLGPKNIKNDSKITCK